MTLTLKCCVHVYTTETPVPTHAHSPAFTLSGQPFLNPDGSPAVYIPPDSQPPIRSQTQPQSAPSQQQQVVHSQAHTHSRPCLTYGMRSGGHTCVCVDVNVSSCPCLHLCLPQVVQYSSVSYSAPQMLPVPPPQPVCTVPLHKHII